MSNHELDIRQVPTLQNIADLNTKGHSRNRFLALLHLFGFVTSKGVHVGEDEFAKQQATETMKKHVKVVGQVLKHGTEHSSVGSSTDLNQTEKRVLRTLSTYSLMDSTGCMSPKTEALGQWQFDSWYFVLRVMLALLCVVAGFGYLVTKGIIRLRGRGLNVNEEQPAVAQADVAVQWKTETDSQVRARYLEERSDPELWQRLRHGGEEDSDSDAPMESTTQHAADVMEAIDRGQGAFGNLAPCNWLLERCTP